MASIQKYRLVLGADVLEAVHAKLQTVAADLAVWNDVSLNTAFAGTVMGAIGG
jgi:hypothetical protein